MGFEAGPQIFQNLRRRDGKTFVRRDGRLDTGIQLLITHLRINQFDYTRLNSLIQDRWNQVMDLFKLVDQSLLCFPCLRAP